MDVEALAREMLSAHDEARLPPRGYKIGFTNRTIWPRYRVFEPIWAPVWKHTLSLLEGVAAEVPLQGLVQPRLEPEIVFGFAAAPRAGMDEAGLAGCIEWVSHGFEIVPAGCSSARACL